MKKIFDIKSNLFLILCSRSDTRLYFIHIDEKINEFSRSKDFTRSQHLNSFFAWKTFFHLTIANEYFFQSEMCNIESKLSHTIWIQSISSVYNSVRLIFRLNFIEHYILMVWHFVELSLVKHQNQIPRWNSTHHKIVQFRDILSTFFYCWKV